MIGEFVMRLFLVTMWSLLSILLSFGQATSAQEQLRISTIERKPFAFKLDEEWAGFSIDLWQEIAKNLDYGTEFVENNSFAEMLASVENRDVDLAAANISITASREAIMDFSQPIFDSGLLVLTPVDGSSSIFSVFNNPQLWAWVFGAVAMFVIAGFLISWIERRHTHFQDRSSLNRFDEGFWWAVSVVTNASFTIFTPVTFLGRLLAYLLIIVGLFVVSAFVAQITASLTVQELRSQVSGFEDLRGKSVGTTENSTSSRFLNQQSIAHVTFMSLDDMFDALEKGELQALVHDAPVLAYYAATTGNGRFQTVGRVFNPEKYGFAMPQGSALQEPINQEILRLRESGRFRELTAKWFGVEYQ